jgi:hypothetical protein
MPLTIQFRYVLSGTTFINAAQIQQYVSELIPSPIPPDLNILVISSANIIIQYSLEFLTPALAAAAAQQCLEGKCPI